MGRCFHVIIEAVQHIEFTGDLTFVCVNTSGISVVTILEFCLRTQILKTTLDIQTTTIKLTHEKKQDFRFRFWWAA